MTPRSEMAFGVQKKWQNQPSRIPGVFSRQSPELHGFCLWGLRGLHLLLIGGLEFLLSPSILGKK